jgi:transcriptional regulator with XRE-family HTH domain
MNNHPFKIYRKKHKLTQRGFAEKIGMSLAAVAGVEVGRIKIGELFAFRIEKALGDEGKKLLKRCYRWK